MRNVQQCLLSAQMTAAMAGGRRAGRHALSGSTGSCEGERSCQCSGGCRPFACPEACEAPCWDQGLRASRALRSRKCPRLSAHSVIDWSGSPTSNSYLFCIEPALICRGEERLLSSKAACKCRCGCQTPSARCLRRQPASSTMHPGWRLGTCAWCTQTLTTALRSSWAARACASSTWHALTSRAILV